MSLIFLYLLEAVFCWWPRSYSFKPNPNRCFPKILKAKGDTKKTKEIRRKAAAIGRVRKIKGLPPEMIRDWRNAFSNMGPRIKARTSGAGS